MSRHLWHPKLALLNWQGVSTHLESENEQNLMTTFEDWLQGPYAGVNSNALACLMDSQRLRTIAQH